MLEFRGTKVLLLIIIVGISTSRAQQRRSNIKQSVTAPTPTYPPEIIESFQRISRGAQEFALELFSKFHDAYGKQTEFMISPFAIWSLLLLLAEGAGGETLQQLQKALHIDQDQAALRAAYRETQKYLNINTSTVEVAALQALFTDRNQPLKPEYGDLLERDYKSFLIDVDFQNVKETYEKINDEVRKATRGLIPYAIQPSDLNDAHMIMISSLYFKGQWKFPFNESRTQLEPFYDEAGNNVGDVRMMVQENHFSYVSIKELEGHVLELPYGQLNRLSMLIIMPRHGTTLNKVVHNLQSFGIAPIFERLTAAEQMFDDDEVEIKMPRFQTHGDYQLPRILDALGISDVFQPGFANLSRMSDRDIFVSNILHSTKIVVDEKGTVAAGMTAGVIINKINTPFVLNRPFLYLIMEKSTNLLLFAGQVVKPNSNF